MGLLVIFMFQNTESVRLDFLFWGFTLPLWLLTLASAFLGALVWFGVVVMRRHGRREERRQDRGLIQAGGTRGSCCQSGTGVPVLSFRGSRKPQARVSENG